MQVIFPSVELQVVEAAGMITLPSSGRENPCWKALPEENPAPRPWRSGGGRQEGVSEGVEGGAPQVEEAEDI